MVTEHILRKKTVSLPVSHMGTIYVQYMYDNGLSAYRSGDDQSVRFLSIIHVGPLWIAHPLT